MVFISEEVSIEGSVFTEVYVYGYFFVSHFAVDIQHFLVSS